MPMGTKKKPTSYLYSLNTPTGQILAAIPTATIDSEVYIYHAECRDMAQGVSASYPHFKNLEWY